MASNIELGPETGDEDGEGEAVSEGEAVGEGKSIAEPQAERPMTEEELEEAGFLYPEYTNEDQSWRRTGADSYGDYLAQSGEGM